MKPEVRMMHIEDGGALSQEMQPASRSWGRKRNRFSSEASEET